MANTAWSMPLNIDQSSFFCWLRRSQSQSLSRWGSCATYENSGCYTVKFENFQCLGYFWRIFLVAENQSKADWLRSLSESRGHQVRSSLRLDSQIFSLDQEDDMFWRAKIRGNPPAQGQHSPLPNIKVQDQRRTFSCQSRVPFFEGDCCFKTSTSLWYTKDLTRINYLHTNWSLVV